MAIPQSRPAVGDANRTSDASPMVFTRRPPKARTTGRTSSSCTASMRAFSSRDCRLVAAVNPFMSVSITARFSVRIAPPRSHARRAGSRRAAARGVRDLSMPPRFSPRRPLGRTGFVATALGAGDLADRAIPKETCAATLRRALDAGLNVVDTAPMYEDGFSEEIVGAALRGRREGVFLADKIDDLDRPVAGQLDESLGRLGLPAVDLLVFHGVSDVAAWRRLEARGGGMAELGEEIARGRARFRG